VDAGQWLAQIVFTFFVFVFVCHQPSKPLCAHPSRPHPWILPFVVPVFTLIRSPSFFFCRTPSPFHAMGRGAERGLQDWRLEGLGLWGGGGGWKTTIFLPRAAPSAKRSERMTWIFPGNKTCHPPRNQKVIHFLPPSARCPPLLSASAPPSPRGPPLSPPDSPPAVPIR
jgi:hypothetical protein